MAQHTQEENTAVVMPMEEEKPLSVCSSSLRSRGEQEQQASGSGIRSLSFSNLFSFRIAKGASSLDMDQLHIAAAAAADGADDADVDADACAEQNQKHKQGKMMMKQQQQAVCRSQSLPMTSIRRLPHNHKKRVADSSALSRFRVSSVPESEETLEAAEEEVGEEEAVCRICMVALWEGGSVLKLECRCKGELALAHRECAVRWFSIKGNANCDVCSHDVLNLPVTLRRIHSHSSDTNAATATATAPGNGSTGGGVGLRGVWQHGTPILVIVSMLAYFCFLEQLLVGDHGTAALAISLPFAGVLGLFSSLTTTKMVPRRYVWIYSAVQFLFIVLFTHLFYRYVRLQAVIAIILATFAGFGIAICGNAMILQIIRRKLRRPPVSDLETARPLP